MSKRHNTVANQAMYYLRLLDQERKKRERKNRIEPCAYCGSRMHKTPLCFRPAKLGERWSLE